MAIESGNWRDGGRRNGEKGRYRGKSVRGREGYK